MDYGGVDAASSPGFTNFVSGLGAALKAKNKTLSIVIPAPERTASVDPATMWNSVGYDTRALADVADSVKLDLSANPAAFGDAQLPALMDWALARVNRSKLQVIVPAGSQRVSATGEVSPIDLAAGLTGCKLDEALVVRDRGMTSPKDVQAVCRRLAVLGVHHCDIAENFTELQGY